MTKNERNWCTKEDADLIERYIRKYRGVKDNPLNGLTFNQILQKARNELNNSANS